MSPMSRSILKISHITAHGLRVPARTSSHHDGRIGRTARKDCSRMELRTEKRACRSDAAALNIVVARRVSASMNVASCWTLPPTAWPLIGVLQTGQDWVLAMMLW